MPLLERGYEVSKFALPETDEELALIMERLVLVLVKQNKTTKALPFFPQIQNIYTKRFVFCCVLNTPETNLTKFFELLITTSQHFKKWHRTERQQMLRRIWWKLLGKENLLMIFLIQGLCVR